LAVERESIKEMLSWISASVTTPFSTSNASIARTRAASGLVAPPVTASWS
jgi:hypothetical protein